MRQARPHSGIGGRLLALLLVLLALSVPGAALAATPAWSNIPLVLREGPGAEYDVTGKIAGEIRIGVERCFNRWCKVRAGGARGWVSEDDISFGQRPGGPFSGPKLNYPEGGPGQVCFYTGTNYTGTSLCSESGTVVHDLVLLHRDNAFASIKIEGNVSALVCRDFDFTSYCERIIKSKPALPRFLIRNVSSYRVY